MKLVYLWKRIVQHPVSGEHQAHKLHCSNMFYKQQIPNENIIKRKMANYGINCN